VYVCAGYVKKATLQVIHLRYGFWYRIFLGATGMMVHLDVLKFTPSPKKKEAWRAAYLAKGWEWALLGYAVWKRDLNRSPHLCTEGLMVCIFVWLDYQLSGETNSTFLLTHVWFVLLPLVFFFFLTFIFMGNLGKEKQKCLLLCF